MFVPSKYSHLSYCNIIREVVLRKRTCFNASKMHVYCTLKSLKIMVKSK